MYSTALDKAIKQYAVYKWQILTKAHQYISMEHCNLFRFKIFLGMLQYTQTGIKSLPQSSTIYVKLTKKCL